MNIKSVFFFGPQSCKLQCRRSVNFATWWNFQGMQYSPLTAYTSPSLHHHLHQYLGSNEGFKTPPSRYHSHQYSTNHHYHHPASGYTESFINYGRFASHDGLPVEIGRGQETPRPSYIADSEASERTRDSGLAFDSGQRSLQLPPTNNPIAQPQIIDSTSTPKIEQAPYPCLGVGSCVCWEPHWTNLFCPHSKSFLTSSFAIRSALLVLFFLLESRFV